MIRPCTKNDFEAVFSIINDAAQAYQGVIPGDRYHEPYMSREYLKHEMDAGVLFWGYEEEGKLVGGRGIQDVQDVTLIGTWAAAVCAIRFYEKHGFRLVTHEEKEQLLRKYWSIPERQTETSVVLADGRWFENRRP